MALTFCFCKTTLVQVLNRLNQLNKISKIILKTSMVDTLSSILVFATTIYIKVDVHKITKLYINLFYKI